jgi:hypothetical protein
MGFTADRNARWAFYMSGGLVLLLLFLLLLQECSPDAAGDGKQQICTFVAYAGVAGAGAVARRRRSLVTASRIAQDTPLLRGRPCILEYKQNKRSLAGSLSLGPASDKPLACLP